MRIHAEEVVCREFGLSRQTLRQWVERGLVRVVVEAGETGFEPDELRRIWSLTSLQQDLDVNLEGAEIILDLADQVRELQAALLEAKRRLDAAQRLESFRVRALGEQLGSAEWDVEL